jgi:chromosome segregation ATPase
MGRKILCGVIIAVAGLLLLLSSIGIGAAWVYNEPVTQRMLAQLHDLDGELAQAQLALDGAETELRRALRILDGAQRALQALSQSTTQAQHVLEGLGEALDNRVLPGLTSASEKLDQVRATLQDALTTLESINSMSLLPVTVPGEQWLSALLQATDSLNSEISNIEELAGQASAFLADIDYVLGGDFGETRQGLERLLAAVSEYQAKVGGWRAQIAMINARLPALIDRACILLTVVLLWFGLSQGGLILHGLAAYKGANPFAVLQKGESLDGP